MEMAELHPLEAERLAALYRLDIVDSQPEAAFDEIVELAGAICETPIALVSLVDKNRQWFKSAIGLDTKETSRSLAFCAHAILQEGVFEVPDALSDVRFFDNPLVLGAPAIRFYAGAPLFTEHGLPLGTLCVIDDKPKQLTPGQTRALSILAGQVMSQMKLRQQNQNLLRLNQYREQLFSALAENLRAPVFSIAGLSKLIRDRGTRLSAENVLQASEDILNSSCLMYQLLDELMQWSQLSLGALIVAPAQHSLWGMVNAVCGLLDFSRDIKGITFINKLPSEIMVESDEMILKSVLRNLLSNAIKYSPMGGQITIECAQDNNRVNIMVTDQGAGVPVSVRDSIFNPPSPTNPNGYNHHGFGLMLSRKFLQLQGNNIYLDTSHSPGTRFIFDLALV